MILYMIVYLTWKVNAQYNEFNISNWTKYSMKDRINSINNKERKTSMEMNERGVIRGRRQVRIEKIHAAEDVRQGCCNCEEERVC